MGKLNKITAALDRVGIWATAYSIMVAVFAWIAKQMKQFDLGWPEAVLIGVAFAAVTVLAISAGLIAWRRFKPLPTCEACTLPQIGEILSETTIESLIAKRIEEAERGTTIRINEIEANGRRLIAYAEQHVRDTDDRFRNVDGGIRAILHRERMSFHADQIEEGAKWLLRSRNGEKIQSWGQWEARRVQWMATIDKWLELAAIYRDGCTERVLNVQPGSLQGDWPEPPELFPSTDAIVAYRTVAVIHANFVKEQDAAGEAVILAAYHRPSMKWRSTQNAN